ncbi:hypothetical protein RI054_32g126300 [Pseudoscourfieldia marina]
MRTAPLLSDATTSVEHSPENNATDDAAEAVIAPTIDHLPANKTKRVRSSTETESPATSEDTHSDEAVTSFGLDSNRRCTRTEIGFSAKERKNLETHMRFGHASREMLRTLQRSGDIRADEYFEEASMPSCYACDAGAMRRKPSPGAKVKEGYSSILFQHPNGDAAGPTRWNTLLLRLKTT